ncbi:hypothetical protein GCM10009834_47700 [Streptomonospora arabica]
MRTCEHKASNGATSCEGRLGVKPGDHGFVVGADEATGADRRIPHGFGATGRGPVAVPGVFGTSGERVHLPTPQG